MSAAYLMAAFAIILSSVALIIVLGLVAHLRRLDQEVRQLEQNVERWIRPNPFYPKEETISQYIDRLENRPAFLRPQAD